MSSIKPKKIRSSCCWKLLPYRDITLILENSLFRKLKVNCSVNLIILSRNVAVLDYFFSLYIVNHLLRYLFRILQDLILLKFAWIKLLGKKSVKVEELALVNLFCMTNFSMALARALIHNLILLKLLNRMCILNHQGIQ